MHTDVGVEAPLLVVVAVGAEVDLRRHVVDAPGVEATVRNQGVVAVVQHHEAIRENAYEDGLIGGTPPKVDQVEIIDFACLLEGPLNVAQILKCKSKLAHGIAG